MTQTSRANSFYIGALLACMGGFLDGYSYLLRDGAFATMQTGNMIYTVLCFANQAPSEAVKYVLSIVAFALGVMVAMAIQNHGGVFWQKMALQVEIFLLVFVGFIPLGQLNLLANVMISFVAAIQTESFKTMGDHNPFASTMCTGNLRSCAEQGYWAVSKKGARLRCLQYALIIGSFMSGVWLATVITPALAEKSIWIVATGLCIPRWVVAAQSHQG